jgi:calcineurin-like phosphoesterase family protein
LAWPSCLPLPRIRISVTAARSAGLNGRSHLIIGNSDGPATVSLPGFASMEHYVELAIENAPGPLPLSLRVSEPHEAGAVNLDGYSHGRLKPVTRQIDVGVDVWNFRPVPLDQLLASRGRQPRRSRA